MRLLSLGVGLAFVVTATACSKDEQQPPATQLGNGDIQTVDPIAMTASFYAPLDGTPSPDGKTVYFTAFDDQGAGVFSVAATGGAVTRLASGEPLTAPYGIMVSTDGTRLFIVDSGAEDQNVRGLGRIFSLAIEGGSLESLAGAVGLSPRSLDVVNENGRDRIYFTGLDANSGKASVFKMDFDGTNLVSISDALGDPSGVAVTKNGVVYVADSAVPSGAAGVIKIDRGQASELAGGMRFGHPAGIALVQDESALFVSGLSTVDSSSLVYRIELATGQVATFNTGISHNHDSAGLHRAHNTDVYAWSNAAGHSRGESFQAGGTVYVLRGKSALSSQ